MTLEEISTQLQNAINTIKILSKRVTQLETKVKELEAKLASQQQA